MNVIFLTMSRVRDITVRGIYSDLMRKFRDEGHCVYIVTPYERSLGKATELYELDGVHILGVKTLNLQKTSIIEKGVGQVLVESQYKRAIKKYLSELKFDLILYSTPPITFPNVIAYLKLKNPEANTYLLLKDIFPQNAVDMGMMSKKGVKGLLYRHFRSKEKKLYRLSDHIGCMSPANVEYLLKSNPGIAQERVEVAPNSLELAPELSASDERKKHLIEMGYIRNKYNLPTHKPIFIYGGNLGKPQGIDFLIKCLDNNKMRDDVFFLIVGDGTEYDKIATWVTKVHEHQDNSNVKLMQRLPKDDYDMLVRSCDVGLIFLDYRFTIPNFPSRLLSYLESKIPVLCATDSNCDMGRIADENGFGYWCESNDVAAFTSLVDKMLGSDRKVMGEKGYAFLKANYLVDNTYNAIMSHV